MVGQSGCYERGHFLLFPNRKQASHSIRSSNKMSNCASSVFKFPSAEQTEKVLLKLTPAKIELKKLTNSFKVYFVIDCSCTRNDKKKCIT